MKVYVIILLTACICTTAYAYRQPYIPLMGTARLGSEKLTHLRLCEGENPNQSDEYGNTPLHYTVFIQSKEVTNLLLSFHANPNAQNKKGKTPLHIAIQKGNDYLARRLLKYGADPNVQDANGDTPLHSVARRTTYKHAKQLIRDLLCYGADTSIENKKHETALKLADTLRIHLVTVHARYKQKKYRSEILTLLQAQPCRNPYMPRVKRPTRMYV